uniref:Uncharacterized protein n=1 Tax=viral metagenome TaxID=1070528 RepID=A0A6C0LXC7_9ZZZZ
MEGVETRVEISDYDTIRSFLRTVALRTEGALLSHLRIVEDVTTLTNGEMVHVANINDYIRTLSLQELIGRMDAIEDMWPLLTESDIVSLWLLAIPQESIPRSIKIEDTYYASFDIDSMMKDMREEIAYGRDLLVDTTASQAKVVGEFKRIPPEQLVAMSDFVLDEITVGISLELPHRDKIIDVFDSLSTSIYVPFIRMVYDNNTYYKVHRSVVPSHEWLEEDQENNTIVMRILRVSKERIKKVKNLYTTAIWDENNNIAISVVLDESMDQELLEERVLSAIDISLPYKKIFTKQVEVKGAVRVETGINRYLLTDMITNDDTVSYFLYVNERKKLATTKKRFYVYYNYSNELEDPITLIITPHADHSDIRIMRAKDEAHVKTVTRILSRIISYYRSHTKNVLDIYRPLFAEFDKLAGITEEHTLTTKVVKPEKKLAPQTRCEQLSTMRPDIFVEGYARKCQKISQPKIVTDEEAKTYEPNMKMYYPRDSGNWYVCAPREESDRDQKRIFPGLMENKTLSNKDTVPYLPACFTSNQYTKRSSTLNEYMKGGTTKKVVATVGVGHVLSAEKNVPSGRYANVPSLIEELLTEAGIKDVSKCKRRGVATSPNSILHCLELAFQTDSYDHMSTDEGKEIQIRNDVRPLLLIDIKAAVAKQEMYNYTLEDIRTYITDVDTFMDPRHVVRILEEYYGCNIFMFVRDSDSDNKYGNILLPFHAGAYIFREYDYETPSVMIVLIPTSEEAYPYQCEIVSFDDELPVNTRFIMRDTRFTRTLATTLYESSVSYDLTLGDVILPQSMTTTGIMAQYIDNYGKRRMNVYTTKDGDALSFVVKPSVPLNINAIENVEDAPITTTTIANQFITDSNLAIESQDVVFNRVVGLKLTNGNYILAAGVEIADVPKSTTSSTNPLMFMERGHNNELRTLRRLRRIATLLKFHSLRLYALNPQTYGADSYVIAKHHAYEGVEALTRLVDTNVLYDSEGRLIIDSETLRNKLMYYVKTMVMKNEEYVAEHATMQIVDNYYANISDFRTREGQLVFDTTDTLSEWIRKERSAKMESSVVYIPRMRTSEPSVVKNGAIFGGRPFLVQNVIDGDITRAMNVCRMWNDEHINKGYHTPSLTEAIPRYDLYDAFGKTRSVEPEVVSEDTTVVNIYDHGNDYYSAMLVI